jgi:hypothetical protein
MLGDSSRKDKINSAFVFRFVLGLQVYKDAFRQPKRLILMIPEFLSVRINQKEAPAPNRRRAGQSPLRSSSTFIS